MFQCKSTYLYTHVCITMFRRPFCAGMGSHRLPMLRHRCSALHRMFRSEAQWAQNPISIQNEVKLEGEGCRPPPSSSCSNFRNLIFGFGKSHYGNGVMTTVVLGVECKCRRRKCLNRKSRYKRTSRKM